MKPYFKSPIHLTIFFAWIINISIFFIATFGPAFVWFVFKGSHASVPLADTAAAITLFIMVPLTIVLLADVIIYNTRKAIK